jgi:tRNA/tmRNA/rRNA uracil-C5-methylase (TrmA/RlmC/RlmD family)
VLIFAFFAEALADVCVWRDPERTMIRLFPKAKDYETIDRKISNQQRDRIEEQLGKPLDPGEREGWIYYKIRGQKGETLGYILTDAEKGEYGVIEIVMGITTDGKSIGLYIQRARERNKEFKSKEFLDQFIGKTKSDPIQIGNDIKAKTSLPTEQIAYGVRKMLVMFDELH